MIYLLTLYYLVAMTYITANMENKSVIIITAGISLMVGYLNGLKSKKVFDPHQD